MNVELKKSGNSLIIAGIFLLVSRLATIIPLLDNWYPKDTVSAAKFSMVFAVIGFVILIIAGVNLVKSSK